MAINRDGAKNAINNLKFIELFAAGKAIQYQHSNGTWYDVSDRLDVSLHPSRLRIQPTDHKFVRTLVTWTGADGKVNERIFKGAKRFAEDWANKNRTYRAFRDTKVHDISVTVPMA